MSYIHDSQKAEITCENIQPTTLSLQERVLMGR